MPYQHCDVEGQALSLPVGKAVCVGRNYLAHIRELGNRVPDEPVLFIKPSTTMVSLQEPLVVPEDPGHCHHELEMAVLIGATISKADEDDVLSSVAGWGVGLDLTLRSVQDQLKVSGLPWERAKGFDGALPISGFVRDIGDPQAQRIRLWKNGELRQDGDTSHMQHSVANLLSHISQTFTLLPGDVVLTGTPAGVGPLRHGDEIRVELQGHLDITTKVV